MWDAHGGPRRPASGQIKEKAPAAGGLSLRLIAVSLAPPHQCMVVTRLRMLAVRYPMKRSCARAGGDEGRGAVSGWDELVH
jgi:hypothetical protein